MAASKEGMNDKDFKVVLLSSNLRKSCIIFFILLRFSCDQHTLDQVT